MILCIIIMAGRNTPKKSKVKEVKIENIKRWAKNNPST